MGYTSNHKNYLDLEMKQTPFNVYTVRESAGYSRAELADILRCPESYLIDAESGKYPLSNYHWRGVLDHCGKRAFDYDPE